MLFSRSFSLSLVFAVALSLIFIFSGGVHAQVSSKKEGKVLRTNDHRPFKSVCSISGNKEMAHCNAKTVTLADGITPLAGSTPYSSSLIPEALHTAYQLPCTPGGLVSSSCSTPLVFSPTIAIVIAYHSPTLENDLQVFSSYFGIPQCTKANGCLQVVNQNGGSSLPLGVNSGWAMEEAMDVQVAHSICQTCKILVVEANSNTYLDLGNAVNTAAAFGAKAISNSYGGGEWSGEKTYDVFYNHPGVAVTVSSGDSGYTTEYPAASPYVIAVGGTTLNLFTDLTYSSETVWSGAGSGCSSYEAVGSWQSALPNWAQTGCGAFRAVSDIAAVADPNTGVAVYDSTPVSGQSGWWQIGGTSLSSPIIAAAFAMGASIPSGVNAGAFLYGNYNPAYLHDIVAGSNGICSFTICNGTSGFDGPTGLGSPNGMGMFGITNTATPTPTLTPSPTATPTPTLTPSPTPIDTQLPTVSITNPSNNSRVSRNTNVTIRASAADNIKVQKVEFYINGVLLSTDLTSAYTASWHVPSPRNVVYTISAKAYDTSGNSSSASVSVTSR